MASFSSVLEHLLVVALAMGAVVLLFQPLAVVVATSAALVSGFVLLYRWLDQPVEAPTLPPLLRENVDPLASTNGQRPSLA